MNKKSRYKNSLLLLFILVSLATVYAKFIGSGSGYKKPPKMDERFEEKFLSINSSGKLDSLVLEEFRASHYDTSKTLLFIDNFLRNRFYHSYSELSIKDNWIAFLCGKLIWSHFLYPVTPGNIIEYPMAACSQQGILFQQQLDYLKIPTSTIQFFPLSSETSGHYAVSAYYGNSWHFYDPNREPYIIDSTMPSIEKIISEKLYEKMYSKPSNIRFQGFFKEKSYKRVNKEPFSEGKMFYFQVTTAFLSSWLWLGLLIMYLICYFRTKTENVKHTL